MATTHVDIWKNCLSIIQSRVTETTYNTWFKNIHSVELNEHQLTVEVPTDFHCTTLEEHYLKDITAAIKQTIGPKGKLAYKVLNPSSDAVPPRNGASKEHHLPGGPQPEITSRAVSWAAIPGMKTVEIKSNLNSAFTFENMVEGDCNRLARSAGIAIANKPGVTAYNPLFIHSSVGLGKTHLLQAIGNYVRANYPRKIVLYVGAEEFTSNFVESVRRGSVNEFMAYYQQVDVLMVDDIQYLAGKDKTQEHFFHIFNHLRQNNHQIVLASDRSPNELQGLEDRLLSRFRWGLTAELKAPDLATRREILRVKMNANELNLPSDVVEFLSDRLNTNVREIESALINLMAQWTLNNKEIDIDLAKQVVQAHRHSPNREVTIEGIQQLVSAMFGVSVESMKSNGRQRPNVLARQVGMYFSKQYTHHSLKMIGRHFGNRDHSTVIHALTVVKDLMDTDKEFRRQVSELENRINNATRS